MKTWLYLQCSRQEVQINNAIACESACGHKCTEWKGSNNIKLDINLRVIGIKFLLVVMQQHISYNNKAIDTSTNSPHYFYRKRTGTANRKAEF